MSKIKQPESGTNVRKMLGWLAALAGALCVGGLTYLLWLLVSGRLTPSAYAEPYALESLQQAVGTASLLLGLGLWALVFLLLARWLDAEVLGWVLLLCGIVLYLGAAALLVALAPQIDLVRAESPGWRVLLILRNHAAGLLCLGALRVAAGMVWNHLTPGTRIPGVVAPVTEGGRSLSRQCWELAFCASALKHHCPRFQHRLSCWRAKSGCYCDGELSRLLMSSAKSVPSSQAASSIQRAAQRARQSASFLASKEVVENKGRPLCVACPIYQEHQRYKFRIISWLVYPAAFLVTWLIAAPLREAWHALDENLGNLMGHVSLLETSTGKEILDLGGTLDLSWVVVVVVGILCVTLLLKISENLVFKQGI